MGAVRRRRKSFVEVGCHTILCVEASFPVGDIERRLVCPEWIRMNLSGGYEADGTCGTGIKIVAVFGHTRGIDLYWPDNANLHVTC